MIETIKLTAFNLAVEICIPILAAPFILVCWIQYLITSRKGQPNR